MEQGLISGKPLSYYLKNLSKLREVDTDDLEKSAQQYPYNAHLHLLIAIKNHLDQGMIDNDKLEKAALYLSDRTKLAEWVNKLSVYRVADQVVRDDDEFPPEQDYPEELVIAGENDLEEDAFKEAVNAPSDPDEDLEEIWQDKESVETGLEVVAEENEPEIEARSNDRDIESDDYDSLLPSGDSDPVLDELEEDHLEEEIEEEIEEKEEEIEEEEEEIEEEEEEEEEEVTEEEEEEEVIEVAFRDDAGGAPVELLDETQAIEPLVTEAPESKELIFEEKERKKKKSKKKKKKKDKRTAKRLQKVLDLKTKDEDIAGEAEDWSGDPGLSPFIRWLTSLGETPSEGYHDLEVEMKMKQEDKFPATGGSDLQDSKKSKKKKKRKSKKKKKKKKAISYAENEAIVSETLAELLASQGYTQKAIDMYKKLGLIIPEKSTLFAQKIEALESKDK